MSLEAVLKIGGSLSRGSGLETLCREIGRLGEHHRLLIVPGGGGFADQVREVYRRFTLDETTAHHMALLAMDQFGYLLSKLIPGSVHTADLSDACRAAETGKAVVLLPSIAVMKADPLPHSWEVTSDTISAWIAHQSHCPRLILLKDIDGLLTAEEGNPSGSLIAELTMEQLAEHSGGVDKYLSHFLSSVRQEAWIINGTNSERLVELLETGHTTGTRIRCS
jgi:5-(aminomethyl)-3-furanmethanol phosphate kinase